MPSPAVTPEFVFQRTFTHPGAPPYARGVDLRVRRDGQIEIRLPGPFAAYNPTTAAALRARAAGIVAAAAPGDVASASALVAAVEAAVAASAAAAASLARTPFDDLPLGSRLPGAVAGVRPDGGVLVRVGVDVLLAAAASSPPSPGCRVCLYRDVGGWNLTPVSRPTAVDGFDVGDLSFTHDGALVSGLVGDREAVRDWLDSFAHGSLRDVVVRRPGTPPFVCRLARPKQAGTTRISGGFVVVEGIRFDQASAAYSGATDLAVVPLKALKAEGKLPALVYERPGGADASPLGGDWVSSLAVATDPALRLGALWPPGSGVLGQATKQGAPCSTLDASSGPAIATASIAEAMLATKVRPPGEPPVTLVSSWPQYSMAMDDEWAGDLMAALRAYSPVVPLHWTKADTAAGPGGTKADTAAGPGGTKAGPGGTKAGPGGTKAGPGGTKAGGASSGAAGGASSGAAGGGERRLRPVAPSPASQRHESTEAAVARAVAAAVHATRRRTARRAARLALGARAAFPEWTEAAISRTIARASVDPVYAGRLGRALARRRRAAAATPPVAAPRRRRRGLAILPPSED